MTEAQIPKPPTEPPPRGRAPATWHYAANRNMAALKELGGWKSEAMVMRYAHVNTDHLRSTIEALPSTKLAQSGNGVS